MAEETVQQSRSLPFILKGSGHGYDSRGSQACYYIIHDGCRRLLKIGRNVYDKLVAPFPLQWMPALLASLDTLDEEWDCAVVTRDSETQGLEIKLNKVFVFGIERIWNHKFIDLRELVKFDERGWKKRVLTATYHPVPLQRPESLVMHSYWAILAHSPRLTIKIAWDDHELKEIQNETDIYRHLTKYGPDIAPKFVAHVQEQGTVIGFASEIITGARNVETIDDLPLCKEVIQRLHNLGIVHRQIYQHDFIIQETDEGKKAQLINFGHAERVDIGSLEGQYAFMYDRELFGVLEITLSEAEA